MLDKKNFLKNKIINLVSISTKDRTIFTKLNSSDIFNPLIFYSEKSVDSLFDNNTTAKLSMKNNWNKLEPKLKKLSNTKDFIKFIDNNSIFVPKIKVNKLSSSFSKNIEDIINYIKLKFELLDKKLVNLDNLARNREADNGEWCLYLGRYFLVGSLSNKETIKSPLFFKEVHINLTDASLKSSEETLNINEKLIVHLIKQEKKNALILKEWNEIKDIHSAILFLNTNFNFNLEMPKKKTDFINEDVPTTKARYNGKLFLEDTCILGFFQPRGGKLKQDLEHIINIGADVFSDKRKTEILNPHEMVLDQRSSWIQISSLNLSQLFAMNLSLNSNTIIHGPPGTGKSETIANIIANIMMNNKNALMVSEKKAALDVLLARLGPLKNFGMFFQDTKITKDKIIFYQTIKNLSDIYNDYDIKGLNFKYSNDIFKNFSNEKQELNKAFKILQEMKSWNIDNFNYNNYLETKYEIINEKNLELIKTYKLNKISKKKFFSLTTYALFLLNKNIVNEIEIKNLHQKMKLSFIDFEMNLDRLNVFWNKLVKFDLKRLHILEIRKIEMSQSEVSLLFQTNVDILKMFSKDIFVYENLEKTFNRLVNYCSPLKISASVLKTIIQNNNYLLLYKALSQVSMLEKKYVISNWKVHNEIKTKKFKKVKTQNWKNIITLINKINEMKIDFTGYLEYLKNKNILSPINVFFFIKSFRFEENLTLFIENNWLDFDPIIPIIIYKENITFEKSQLANKVFGFENKYINEANIKLINEYSSINEYAYLKSNLDWETIINEVYQKLIITWKLKIDHSKYNEDILEMFRISNLKRFPKIKTFIKKYFYALTEIFPIWIARPEDVSDMIECKSDVFDYGIFDEASQMFLERAYPVLFRTNIKIVAGDDKQLKPSSFFNTRYHEEEEEEEEEDNGKYKIKYSDLDSLLLRAMVSDWNEILLNNHYRSVSQELIEFSNKNIYDEKLNVASYNRNFNSKSFEVMNINGFFIDRKNNQEAMEVVKIIENNLFNYKKILVITFNESQSELISSKILSSKNKELISSFRLLKIIVTNLENVQGNEGDLVILSVAYGKPSVDRKMRNAFGPLSMDGGKNRLNVGITRAKEKMIVLKSFSAQDMSISKSNTNAQFFKNFIIHCDDVSNNLKKEKISLELETDFGNSVSNYLEKYIPIESGLLIIPRYKIGTKRIDIVIFNKQTNKVLLGLELHRWLNNSRDIFEDFDKLSFINDRGYKIYNIFEIEWRKNKEKTLKTILKFISKKN